MTETTTIERPQKLTIDCSTGEAFYEDLTDEEIAANQAAAEAAAKQAAEEEQARVDAEAKRKADHEAVLNSPLLAGDPAAHAALARLLGIEQT